MIITHLWEALCFVHSALFAFLLSGPSFQTCSASKIVDNPRSWLLEGMPFLNSLFHKHKSSKSIDKPLPPPPSSGNDEEHLSGRFAALNLNTNNNARHGHGHVRTASDSNIPGSLRWGNMISMIPFNEFLDLRSWYSVVLAAALFCVNTLFHRLRIHHQCFQNQK